MPWPVKVWLQDAPEDEPYLGVAFPDGTTLPLKEVDEILEGPDANPFLSLAFELEVSHLSHL